MESLSPRSIVQLVLMSSLIVLALSLSGCAAPSSVVCEEPKPLPTALTEPSSPAARSYSERVSSFFLKVESWLSEKQREPTR